jgi:hypothetical protein
LAIPALFVAAVTISCKKDKPLTSESNEITTTKDGQQFIWIRLNSRVEWKGYKVLNLKIQAIWN